MLTRFRVIRSSKLPRLSFTYGPNLVLQRTFSVTRGLMNKIGSIDETIRKGKKSHRPTTLQEQYTKSLNAKETESASERSLEKNSRGEEPKKQRPLEIANLGPKKPVDWRKMKNLPEWQRQKFALIEKFKGEKWDPKKKLSRQDMNSVKLLKQNLPEITTKELSEHFAISPEAIRRILRSKWKPTNDEEDAIHERWKRRGEKIKGMMKEKFIPRTPKVVINSVGNHTKVKFTKKNDLHTGEKKVKVNDAHKRIQKVSNRNSLRKMKF